MILYCEKGGILLSSTGELYTRESDCYLKDYVKKHYRLNILSSTLIGYWTNCDKCGIIRTKSLAGASLRGCRPYAHCRARAS